MFKMSVGLRAWAMPKICMTSYPPKASSNNIAVDWLRLTRFLCYRSTVTTKFTLKDAMQRQQEPVHLTLHKTWWEATHMLLGASAAYLYDYPMNFPFSLDYLRIWILQEERAPANAKIKAVPIDKGWPIRLYTTEFIFMYIIYFNAVPMTNFEIIR